jgi:hypothetical protein
MVGAIMYQLWPTQYLLFLRRGNILFRSFLKMLRLVSLLLFGQVEQIHT